MTEIREKVSRLLNCVNEYGDFCIEPEDYMDFVHLLIQALDKAEADTCDWNYLEEEEYYETDCGNCFYMLDECTLSDSEFKYCIYCGKRLTTKANE